MSSATISPADVTGLPIPPGPSGVKGAGALARLIRDPWLYPLKLTQKYGDIVSIPTPFVKTIYVGHPDWVDHVLVQNPDRYRRSDMVAKQMVPPKLGHNFFAFADDPEWRRGRSLYRPSFTQKNLAELGDLFTASVTAQVDSWAHADGAAEGYLDIEEMTRKLALIVLFNAMFDEYLSPRMLEASMTKKAISFGMLATTARVGMYSFPAWVPRPFQRRMDSMLEMIMGGADQLIEMRRRHPTERTDILNLLINATYDDGSPLENDKIAVEIAGMIVGGHETTAAALAWTFALVSGHPEIERRLIAEVDSLDGKPVTVADMARLPLARACFDEAQRLQGGLVINPKTALVDDEMGGYRIAAGTTILYSSLALQRDPRFWPEPNRYNPDRFLDNEADLRAFVPFGRGQRLCLGMRMAYIEAVLTIATAYQRYRFELPKGYEPRHQYRMSMGLKGGLPARVVRR
ncbi:cytochrome P450 [Mycobacteroides franklinii]|uniref:cytochrome P450 n=1 Tax=Mycobacteroides franklinii TaxID=948102 RepID=UPI0013E8A71B|nr:cytochrome P450 [Mycobacteroides franklinii]